jgi:L-lactate dehydrogenase complex protein LldF
MQVSSQQFKRKAAEALANPQLHKAMSNLRVRMVTGRAQSILELDNFETIREAAKQTRDFALSRVDRTSRYLQSERDERSRETSSDRIEKRQ